MRKSALLLATMMLLCASSAGANVLSITFDFAADTVITTGNITIPPDGDFTAASGTLTVPALGSSTPLAGSAQLTGLLFEGTINRRTGPFATFVTGSFDYHQIGTAFGTFNQSAGAVAITRGLVISQFLMANCLGIFCPTGYPITNTGISTVNDTVRIQIHNLATPGSATIMTLLTFTFNDTTVMLDLVGTEVSRVVPEPGGLWLLSSGGVALAGMWGLRQRRRRRR